MRTRLQRYGVVDAPTASAIGIIQPGEHLVGGIWPHSIAILMSAFYVMLFIIRPWEQLFPWLGTIHFERLYAICMVGATLFSAEKNRLTMTWQTMTVLFFITAYILCSLLAQNPSLAWEEFYTYLTLVLFYFILLSLLRTPYSLAFIVITYIASLTIYLGKAQWEFFINGQHRYDMGVIRMVGIEDTFGGPNNLGMSINISLPFALLLWQQKDAISASWPGVWQKRFRRGLQLFGLLAISSIVLTNSRSSMIGFVVFVLLWILGSRGFGRKVGYLTGGLCVLALIWVLMPAANKGRLQTVWAPEKGPLSSQVSADGRVEGYKAGMEMLSRFPFSGVGPGNFVEYRVPNIDGVALQAHNLAGQLLGEMGALGGVTFLLLVMATLKNCSNVKLLTTGSPNSSLHFLGELAIACRNSLLLLLFLGTFGHNLYRFNWLWLAAFSVLARQFTVKIKQDKDFR